MLIKMLRLPNANVLRFSAGPEEIGQGNAALGLMGIAAGDPTSFQGWGWGEMRCPRPPRQAARFANAALEGVFLS